MQGSVSIECFMCKAFLWSCRGLNFIISNSINTTTISISNGSTTDHITKLCSQLATRRNTTVTINSTITITTIKNTTITNISNIITTATTNVNSNRRIKRL